MALLQTEWLPRADASQEVIRLRLLLQWVDVMRREYEQRTLPPIGHFAIKPGSKVRVTNEVKCYPLPRGLSPGELVVVLSFDGCYKIQRGQDVFTINSCNIVGRLVGRELSWEAIIEF